VNTDKRIKALKLVLNRVREICGDLDFEIGHLGNLLLKANIGVPCEEGFEIIKNSNSPLTILVLVDEDKKYPHFNHFFGAGLKGRASAAALYDSNYQMILVNVSKVSVDYLASVLIHEAVHNQQEPASVGDLEGLSRNELGAHLIHFIVLDYLGEKNPRYYIALKEEAEWAASFYQTHNHPPGFAYEEEAKRVRRFFQSDTKNQDYYWYTLWWMRRTYEMFYILYQNNDVKASHEFRKVLKDVLSASIVD
jgi:hypothetical protein